MSRRLALAGCALFCSLLGALVMNAAALADASFEVPRAELLAAIKTIGLLPIEIEHAVPHEDEVAAQLEQEITERLQSGGFKVVPASAMRAIRERGLRTLGGLYDPMTGVSMPGRLEALREFSRNEYRAQYPIDAILIIRMISRRAKLSVGKAEWDGVREQVSTEGAITTTLQFALGSLPGPGEVRALSLSVRLVNVNGATLYTGRGGLLVLEYPTMRGTLVEYDLSAADPQYSLSGPTLISRATTIAVDPLTAGSAPATPYSFTVPPPHEPTETQVSNLKELLRQSPRLSVIPLELPGLALEQSDQVKARYARELGAKFHALGFDVVGDAEIQDLWAAAREAAGGFFDAITGRLDDSKLRAARMHLFTQLRQRYDTSALVIPTIVQRSASFSMGYAKWDGSTQPVSGAGSWLFNNSIFNPNLEYSGNLEALSLNLRILDRDDQVLFQGLGAVQLAQYMDHGGVVPVPDTAFFAEPANYKSSIALALRRLGSTTSGELPAKKPRQ